MKTLHSDLQLENNVLEARIARHASRLDKVHSIKPVLLVIILAILAMLSKLYAQSGLEDKIASVQYNSNIRLASFTQSLPQAEKLPAFINTSFREIGPLVSPDGRTLYFSRQNYPDNTGGVLDYEDIWFSTYNERTGMWSAPEKMDAPINNLGPNSVNFVSVTGDTLLLANKYGKRGKMKAGMSMSIRQNGVWSYPQPVKSQDHLNMSDRFNMFMTYNKQIILTSQQMDDSYGNRDIYATLLYPDGSEKTFNLGATVNTELDESSPFLAPDYKTLYFASKGHNGFGGFDIYVTHRLDESWQKWSEPENLGPVVNSDKDEEFFNFTYDGQYAYFSKQVSEQNTDIYRVSLAGLYRRSISRDRNSSVAESGLQDINNMGLNSYLGSEYANLDE